MKKKKLEAKLEKAREKLAATESRLASVLSELERGAGPVNGDGKGKRSTSAAKPAKRRTTAKGAANQS